MMKNELTQLPSESKGPGEGRKRPATAPDQNTAGNSSQRVEEEHISKLRRSNRDRRIAARFEGTNVATDGRTTIAIEKQHEKFKRRTPTQNIVSVSRIVTKSRAQRRNRSKQKQR